MTELVVQGELFIVAGSARSIPARLIESNGALRLVSLEQVMTVGLPPDLPEAPGALETEADAELYGTVVKVAVLLVDGNVIEGGVAFAAPPGSSRLQDHLNHSGRFIELHTSEGRVLVNKRFISHVGVLS